MDANRKIPLTARQRARINTDQSLFAARQKAADREKRDRVAPITGTVTGYDGDRGEFIARTPDGGSIGVSVIGNTQPIGETVPIVRYGAAQQAYVPTDPAIDFSDIYGSIESVSVALYDLLSVANAHITIEQAEDLGYPMFRANQRYRVLATRADIINDAGVVTGSSTFTASHAVGQVVDIDEVFIVTLSGTNGDRTTISGIFKAV